MKNQLREVEKNLRYLAKRYKGITFSTGLVLLYLMLGVNAFSEETVANIENQVASKKEIGMSADRLSEVLREIKAENEKKLKGAKLELVQLTEQGDQVVKSPWSSWQFGMNYIYESWGGSYKGRGDKKQKYPYEGIFTRDSGADEMNRYVSSDSSYYSTLASESSPTSASSNRRKNLGQGYGIASTQPVPEPIIDLELSAGIRPKVVNKADLNLVPKAANIPTLPDPVRFSPINPNIVIPADPALPAPPTFAIVLGADCNEGCNSNGSTPRQNTKAGFLESLDNESKQNINVILHYTWSNGRGAERGYAFKMYKETNTTVLPAIAGDNYYFNSYNFGNGDTKEFAGGVANATSGIDKNHQRFFIGGSRFWEIDNTSSGTFTIPSTATVNLGGIYTLALVSQENGTTLRNEGIITDKEEKNDKYIQDTPQTFTIEAPTSKTTITKNADGYVGYKVGIAQVQENGTSYNSQNQKLENAKTIDFRGNNSMGMYVYLPSNTTYTKMKNESTGVINISGAESYGMKIAAKSDNSAEMLNEGTINVYKNPDGNAKADNSVGMAIMNDPTVSGGVTFGTGKAKNSGTINITDVENSLGTYVNIATDIENTSTGKIKINANVNKATAGSQSVNIGMRADDNANAKVINSGEITIDGSYAIGMLASGAKLTNTGSILSTDIKNGVGIVGINNATIENSGAIKVVGTGDTNNIGIFLNTNSTGTVGTKGTTNQSIEVLGDNSTGVLVSGGSKLTMEGGVKVSGNSVSGIVANGTDITLNGVAQVTVDNNGNVSNPIGAKGSYGIVVKKAGGAGKFIGTNTDATVKVTNPESIGLYSEGELELAKANIIAENGAINFFANDGKISTQGGTTTTGKKSLLFYTSGNNAKVLINAPMTSTIKGGANPSERGTAFYYVAPGATYGKFDTAAIQNYFNTTFGNGASTLNNLTLNMEQGSRLFVASNVEMNLTNTSATNLMSGIVGAPTITGSNYKTFMLYLSKLNVDTAVNLDNAADAYNQLEIANSSITNASKMTGSSKNQVAMAQENGLNPSNVGYPASKVTLINDANGTIELTGEGSTAIYAKRGQIDNDGTISVGDNSTAIYLIEDNLGDPLSVAGGTVSNDGTIKLGKGSTGIYYKAETTGPNHALDGGVINAGKIESKANNVIGITFESPYNNKKFRNTGTIELKGDASTAMYATGNGTYTALNEGTIELGNSADANNPNVGMFTDKAAIKLENKGKIVAGDKAVGLYGYGISLTAPSQLEVGAGGTGVYSKGGNVDIAGTLKTGQKEAVAVYYVGTGGAITNNASKIEIGDSSYGFVIKNPTGGNILTSNTANVSLGKDVVYIYSNDKNGTITNNTVLKSTGDENYAVYAAGNIINNADIDFSTGIGNVALYSISGGLARNLAGKTITVGDSDTANSKFGIAMAAGYEKTDTGRLENAGTLNVNGKNSIGMYATGIGSEAKNSAGATINLAADGAIGMYLDNGAKGFNDGTITTVGTPNAVVGVVVRGGAEFTNNGTIHIDSPNGYAFFKAQGGIIKNYGTFTLGSGAKKEFAPGSKPTGKEVGGVKIDAPAGADKATITLNGITQPIVSITNPIGQRAPLTSSFGMYIDTLKGTNPIGGLLPSGEADLIIGAEASQATKSKYINLSGTSSIIDPYNKAILGNPQITSWKIYSGAMNWIATATLDQNTGLIKNIYLAKIPYTSFAGNEPSPVDRKDTYNFLDGLEQRYGVEELGTRENQLFQKLNSIGKNEEVLFFQAVDEMMGHQYANIQQRIHSTGRILDKEFDYLKDEWRTASKDSNKIKVFGMKGEYSTDTAGVIDY
ncbi:autotransporter-associated N-terminal domain-containing protein, partial [Fusobacterium russii]|uniref:autotransporter-associated N-terminal domain-containing protein n=1 Tax=Fusobacterium russii TaxID=854 RepID=UPI0003B426D2